MGIELVVVLGQSLVWFITGVLTGTLWKEARVARVRE
jgi:hypothetical protein